MTSQYEVDRWIEELKKDAKFKRLWKYYVSCKKSKIEKTKENILKK
jgi:hypothetical protein